MARSRGSRYPRTGGANRRRTAWNDGPFTTSIQRSAEGATIWSSGQTPNVSGLTIARIRGSWSCNIVDVTAADAHFDEVAVGIGITSVDAFNIGITALPTPLGDMSWPGWLYHEMVSGMIAVEPTELFGNAGSGAYRGVIDSKARRKLGPNEIIFGVFETGVEGGALIVQCDARTRMLVYLP